MVCGIVGIPAQLLGDRICFLALLRDRNVPRLQTRKCIFQNFASPTRERERDSSHFGSSTAPLLGGLCCSLASGGSWEVNLDCASRGVFPVAPAVLESLRPLPHCLRGPFESIASLEPDRGPLSGGGPPVGERAYY